MKKVVLSLAFVAMMFVSCKETADTTTEEVENVEAIEATPEVMEETIVVDTVTPAVEEVKVEEAAK